MAGNQKHTGYTTVGQINSKHNHIILNSNVTCSSNHIVLWNMQKPASQDSFIAGLQKRMI